jgi:hypothetical protein
MCVNVLLCHVYALRTWDRHDFAFILEGSTAKKLHLELRLITKCTLIAVDVASFFRIITVTCNSKNIIFKSLYQPQQIFSFE